MDSRKPRRMTTTRVLAACLALAVSVQPAALTAQSADEVEVPSRWRRWAGAAGGALIMGGVASLTDQADEEARSGVCNTTTCVMSISALLGAGLGFLLGYEADKRAVRRALEGPTVEVALTSVELSESPIALVDAGTGVVALTREWVFLVDEGMRANRLLQGFPARAATVAMDGELLLISSNQQVVGVLLPQPADEPSTLLVTGASALLSLEDGALAVGEPGRLRLMDLTGSSRAPSVMETGTVATRGLPAALTLAGGVLWTIEDSSVVSRNATTLAEVGRVTLPGRAVSLFVAGPLAMVSMGGAGATMLDVANPASPRVTTALTGMDFAFDAVALDGRLYVAAGQQGVFVYDATGGRDPVRLGVVRDMDFAGDLLVKDGHLYILDRAAGRLFRM